MNKKSADGRLSNNHPVERGDRVLTEAAVAVAGTKRDEFILQPGPCCGGEFGDDSRGPGAQRGPAPSLKGSVLVAGSPPKISVPGVR